MLLHPSSLPGRFGIGSLGEEAFRFAAFLASAGQRLWQVLPLVPTGYGDSPYQGLGAFAGNPLLLDPEELRRDGLLGDADLADAPAFAEGAVDYAAVIAWKGALLRHAADRCHAGGAPADRRSLEDFAERHASWLGDFALFQALKARHGGRPWTAWPPALARRDPGTLRDARAELAGEIRAQVFGQWAFFRQWARLRERCRSAGIRLMGDLPIYVAHDSAEVWARPELFQLDAQGRPAAVAGVPPDYFSATGQLWGNPLYRWEAARRTGWAFWIERMRSALELVDLVRLDHFRGFEAFWEVQAGEPDARRGRWVPGPGAELFDALRAALGPLPAVAENLGVITPEVEALRRRQGFPGMAILQFAFGNDPQAPSFLPHNYSRDLVAYTGTHDNDTVLGWWTGEGPGVSTRTAEDVRREREHARRYLAAGGEEMNWVFIRTVLASVADTAVFPLQDVLGLGSEARMNRPSVPTGNWRWRLLPGRIDERLAGRLADLAALYGRV